MRGKSLRYLTVNMIGFVGMFGENQDNNLASVDSLGDCFGPIGSRLDVSRGDPALDPVRLEPLANCLRYGFVLARMADKDARRH
jgi:hypothetical protein